MKIKLTENARPSPPLPRTHTHCQYNRHSQHAIHFDLAHDTREERNETIGV